MVSLKCFASLLLCLKLDPICSEKELRDAAHAEVAITFGTLGDLDGGDKKKRKFETEEKEKQRYDIFISSLLERLHQQLYHLCDAAETEIRSMRGLHVCVRKRTLTSLKPFCKR